MKSKSELAIVLSRLEGFKQPDMMLEQYQTPSEIAADMLWNANLHGDTQGKWVDLACGPGILGIGALLMGVDEVFFVDISAEVLKICENNVKKLKSEGYELGKSHFRGINVSEFNETVDVVIQNPPFGTQTKRPTKNS